MDNSTASEETSSTSSNDDDIDVGSVAAVVVWSCNKENKSLTGLQLQLRHHVSAGEAFFQLRAVVRLKSSPRTDTPLFLIVDPERIRSLALGTSEGEETKAAAEAAVRKLRAATACLHLKLYKPADLVGPRDVVLTPRNRSVGDRLDLIRLLARQDDFVVYFPQKIISNARLSSLCRAASCGQLRLVPRHEIARLYGGKGGQVVEGVSLSSTTMGASTTIATAPTASAQTVPTISEIEDFDKDADSPPSYDELGPSPVRPQPPTANKYPGDVLPANGMLVETSQVGHCHDRKKRRRCTSPDPALVEQPHVVELEGLLKKIMADERAKARDEVLTVVLPVVERLETRIRLLEESNARLAGRCEAVLTRLQTEQDKWFEERQDSLQGRLDEVVQQVQDIVESEVDDRMYFARDDLKDYIQENARDLILDDIKEAVRDELQSVDATVSFQFSGNS